MTSIDPCPECKKRAGWIWHWSSFGKDSKGYGECMNCGWEDKK